MVWSTDIILTFCETGMNGNFISKKVSEDMVRQSGEPSVKQRNEHRGTHWVPDLSCPWTESG